MNASPDSDSSVSPLPTPLVIVGAGGHAREVALIARRVNPAVEILGLVADDLPDTALLEGLGHRFLGRPQEVDLRHAQIVVAIGSSRTRRELVERLSLSETAGFARLVDPDATLAPDARLGEGAIVFPRSVVSTNVALGAHCCINSAAVVSHDVTLGDFVTVSPGVLLNGAVTVGDGAFLGSGAIVLPGISVGAGATVGAGAVVITDVADGATVVGVPARG